MDCENQIKKPLLSTRAKTIEVKSSLRNNPYCDLLRYKDMTLK
jgi:hypothetical protein